jgi:hypothetical protein
MKRLVLFVHVSNQLLRQSRRTVKTFSCFRPLSRDPERERFRILSSWLWFALQNCTTTLHGDSHVLSCILHDSLDPRTTRAEKPHHNTKVLIIFDAHW